MPTDKFPATWKHSRYDRRTRRVTVRELTDSQAWDHLHATAGQSVTDAVAGLRAELHGQSLLRDMAGNGEHDRPVADLDTLRDTESWLNILEGARQRGDADGALWAALYVGEAIGKLKLDILRRGVDAPRAKGRRKQGERAATTRRVVEQLNTEAWRRNLESTRGDRIDYMMHRDRLAKALSKAGIDRIPSRTTLLRILSELPIPAL